MNSHVGTVLIDAVDLADVLGHENMIVVSADWRSPLYSVSFRLLDMSRDPKSRVIVTVAKNNCFEDLPSLLGFPGGAVHWVDDMSYFRCIGVTIEHSEMPKVAYGCRPAVVKYRAARYQGAESAA